MIVTKIEPQKRDQTRYNVFVDGEFAFGLIMEDIQFFKLKEGGEISQKTYDYIRDAIVYIKAQDMALKYLGFKKRTEKEIRRKLSDAEFDEEIISRVMEFLIKYNYINDLDYAESFIRQTVKLNPKGRMEITRKLRELGVLAHVIDEAFLNEAFDEGAGARRLLLKKLGEGRTVTWKEKKKLQDFLRRRGYSYGIINDIFNELEIKTEKEEEY